MSRGIDETKGQINDHDSIALDGKSALGYVGGGANRYVFTGSLETFSLAGDATVRLSGTEINPADYGKTLEIVESGPRADYSFDVSGEINEAKGFINDHDTITKDGKSASGHVGWREGHVRLHW